TVMAAYLAGRRGRPRDALVVGATVTLTHTGGVLAVGLLLSTSTAFAGDRLLAYLGVASGLLVVLVGTGRTRTNTITMSRTASWDSPAWGSPGGWCRARRRWSYCSARSGSAGPA